MTEILKKAIELIAPLAKQYKPKNDANWVCTLDKQGEVNTLEEYNSDTYCEDCIEKVIRKIRRKDVKLPKNFKKFTYQTETSKEGEDFCVCSECGEIIEQSVIFTSQEIEYWNTLPSNEFNEALKNNRSCYELLELITDKFIDKKHQEAVRKIRERIIK